MHRPPERPASLCRRGPRTDSKTTQRRPLLRRPSRPALSDVGACDMNRLIWCLSLIVACASGLPASGADFWSPLGRELACIRCASAPCCCVNDYCRKPTPCVPCPPLLGECDDYCRKPPPCVMIPCLPSCCDDYCRKPFPNLCCAASSACSSGAGCRGGGGCLSRSWLPSWPWTRGGR